jgi:dihydroxy-acid dehydratase
MRRVRHLLHLDAMTVTGRTLGEEINLQPSSFPQVIVRSLENPIHPHSSIVVLKGNLAPNGAILKASAMDPRLRCHEGSACVFHNMDDLVRRIDAPNLNVDENSV